MGRGGGLGRWNRGVQRWGVPSLPCLSIVPGQFCGFRLGAGASGWRREGWEEVANSLFRAPTEDTGYHHLAFVDGMAGWRRVGPLRGLLLIPVTLRDESRRWGGDAAAGGGGARQQGSRSHFVMETWPHANGVERSSGHHKDLSAPRYPAGACASAAPD